MEHTGEVFLFHLSVTLTYFGNKLDEHQVELEGNSTADADGLWASSRDSPCCWESLFGSEVEENVPEDVENLRDIVSKRASPKCVPIEVRGDSEEANELLTGNSLQESQVATSSIPRQTSSKGGGDLFHPVLRLIVDISIYL